MALIVDNRTRAPKSRRQRGPMTPVVLATAATFRAPVARPGDIAGMRQEMWAATSTDGTWGYARLDDRTTPWEVTYLPTGQTRGWYSNIYDAREATASPKLLGELRREAVEAAFEGPVAGRPDAHRWLAVHLRRTPGISATTRCQCGGYLLLDASGAAAHVDVCSDCLDCNPDAPSCDLTEITHRCCPHPREVLCAHIAGGPCQNPTSLVAPETCAAGFEHCCGCCGETA